MKSFICDNFKKAICYKCGEFIFNNKGEQVMVCNCAKSVKHITCNTKNPTNKNEGAKS